MKFVSVHGDGDPATFREALFRGLAPDGGLYVPVSMPRLDEAFLAHLEARTLPDFGVAVLSRFIDDVAPADLGRIVRDAWNFSIPLTPLTDRIHLLELFHGPTLAFKDVGARFMARMLSHYLRRDEREVTILVATSGDTGSAVAHGFHGVPHVNVFVLYPSGRISALQEMQIATLGGNIHALEIEGTFDDCQALVKRALSDEVVRRARDLTTANSINVGRLLPQVAYYGWAAAQWLAGRDAGASGGHDIGSPAARAADLRLRVVVPSGNFGNITAAAYARAMGIAFGRLVAATNANDVVPEYFRTGALRTRPSLATLSNAMDVGNPSNLARLLALCGGDLVALRRSMGAESVDDDETLREIQRTWEDTGRVIDPHTAVGVAVARRLLDELSPGGDVIVPATAHPAKFPEVIGRTPGMELPVPAPLIEALGRPKQSTRLPASYDRVRAEILSTPPRA